MILAGERDNEFTATHHMLCGYHMICACGTYERRVGAREEWTKERAGSKAFRTGSFYLYCFVAVCGVGTSSHHLVFLGVGSVEPKEGLV